MLFPSPQKTKKRDKQPFWLESLLPLCCLPFWGPSVRISSPRWRGLSPSICAASWWGEADHFGSIAMGSAGSPNPASPRVLLRGDMNATHAAAGRPDGQGRGHGREVRGGGGDSGTEEGAVDAIDVHAILESSFEEQLEERRSKPAGETEAAPLGGGLGHDGGERAGGERRGPATKSGTDDCKDFWNLPREGQKRCRANHGCGSSACVAIGTTSARQYNQIRCQLPHTLNVIGTAEDGETT